MTLLQYIPQAYHSPVEFLLAASLVAACFSYVWPIVAATMAVILGFAFPRVNWSEIVTITIGHGLLALVLGSLTRSSSLTHPNWGLTVLVIGGAVLLAFIAENLYELSISTSREAMTSSRVWNIAGAILLLLWLSTYAATALMTDIFPLPIAVIGGLIRMLLVFPYVSYLAAALGVIVLPPLLVKAVFACIGLVQLPFNRTPELR